MVSPIGIALVMLGSVILSLIIAHIFGPKGSNSDDQ